MPASDDFPFKSANTESQQMQTLHNQQASLTPVPFWEPSLVQGIAIKLHDSTYAIIKGWFIKSKIYTSPNGAVHI